MRRSGVAVVAAGAVAAAAAVGWRLRSSRARSAYRQGTFPHGMEYAVAGRGPRVLLFIQGGPGSSASPTTASLRPWIRPLTEAGFAVWVVTRRRGMPPGHTVADMADDYAQVVAQELGGRVDVVLGESFGGLIAQQLAASHPELLGRLVLLSAACEVSAWGKDVDTRLVAALERGDRATAGATFAEYALPGERMRWARRLLGPLAAREMLTGGPYPVSDIVVETRSEAAFDSRALLPRLEVPVLLVSGDRDRFFPRALVEETARLVPACTLIWRPGRGHLGSTVDKRNGDDILAFVGAG